MGNAGKRSGKAIAPSGGLRRLMSCPPIASFVRAACHPSTPPLRANLPATGALRYQITFYGFGALQTVDQANRRRSRWLSISSGSELSKGIEKLTAVLNQSLAGVG